MSPISRVAAGAWPITPLGDVCQVVTGSTPPRGESRYFGGSVPWIKPEDLNTSLYVVGSKEYLTDDGARLARRVPKGSVLVSCIGKIGKVAIAGVDLAVNQQINCLVPGPRVVSEYLYYAMRFEQGNLQDQASNTIVPILNKSRFAAVGIPLPPLADQQRIVAKLDKQMAALDRAEKALAEQQAAASAVATAVLQQAFSGPECTRWPSVRLVRAGTFDAGGTPAKDQQRYWSDTGYPFVTGADITSATVGARNARAFLTQEGLVSGKTAVCPAGTVLVVTRTRVGRVGIAGETVAVSQDITAFTCQRNLLPTYVMWFLRKESDHLIAQSRGATIQGLRRSVLENLDIPVPSIPEQRQIAESIEQATHNVAMLQQSITYQLGTLTSLRTSFLDAAFSGEI